MAKLRFEVGAISDIGMKRANNEDNLFVPGQKIKEKYVNIYNLNKLNNSKPLVVDGEENAFFAVCDGMGGHNGGEEASFIAVHSVSNMYSEIIKPTDYKSAIESFEKVIEEINSNIDYAAEGNPLLRGMGSTICGIYAFDDKIMPVNVGDSRVYMMHKGKITKISMDHTDTVDGKGALTRYLGVPAELGAVTPYCGIEPFRILDKTRFLLCSDGLTDMLDDEKIEAILNNNQNPVSAADELINTAKKLGGDDNVTVEVIDVIPTSNALGRRLKKPSTYIISAVAVVIVAAGVILYNSFAPLVAPEYSGISLDISGPDKELVLKLSPDGVTEEKINELDPADPGYINPEDNFELQIKRLEKKLDFDYPIEAVPDGSDAQPQKDAWAQANSEYEEAKNNARRELEPLETLREEAYNISLKPVNGEEGGEDFAKDRSEERKSKAEELQSKINEYNQKYFGGNTNEPLLIAKTNAESAKAAYDTEIQTIEAARAAEAERQRRQAESKTNSSNSNSKSESGGSKNGSGSRGNSGGNSQSGGNSGSGVRRNSGGDSGARSDGGASNSNSDVKNGSDRFND